MNQNYKMFLKVSIPAFMLLTLAFTSLRIQD